MSSLSVNTIKVQSASNSAGWLDRTSNIDHAANGGAQPHGWLHADGFGADDPNCVDPSCSKSTRQESGVAICSATASSGEHLSSPWTIAFLNANTISNKTSSVLDGSLGTAPLATAPQISVRRGRTKAHKAASWLYRSLTALSSKAVAKQRNKSSDVPFDRCLAQNTCRGLTAELGCHLGCPCSIERCAWQGRMQLIHSRSSLTATAFYDSWARALADSSKA